MDLNNTHIDSTVCQQRRDQLISDISALSDFEMNELGVWTDNVESIVDDLVFQMGCTD